MNIINVLEQEIKENRSLIDRYSGETKSYDDLKNELVITYMKLIGENKLNPDDTSYSEYENMIIEYNYISVEYILSKIKKYLSLDTIDSNEENKRK